MVRFQGVRGDGGAAVAVTPTAFYASAQGGRVAFNATTGVLQVGPAVNAQAPVALFRNPVSSPCDVFLDVGEFGASFDATFRRWSGVSAKVSVDAAVQHAANRGGGSLAACGELFVPAGFSWAGGVVSKTAHVGAFAQYITRIEGGVVLRPGAAVVWTVEGRGGSVSVFLEWWELPAAA